MVSLNLIVGGGSWQGSAGRTGKSIKRKGGGEGIELQGEKKIR